MHVAYQLCLMLGVGLVINVVECNIGKEDWIFLEDINDTLFVVLDTSSVIDDKTVSWPVIAEDTVTEMTGDGIMSDVVVLDNDVVDIEGDTKPVKLVDNGVTVTGRSALIIHVSCWPIQFPLAKLKIHNLISLFVPLNTKPTPRPPLQL